MLDPWKILEFLKTLHLIAEILEHREIVSSKSYVRDLWAKIPIMGHNSHLLIPKSDFFFFLTVPCGMWDLSCPARDQTRVACVGKQSLNLWTSGEDPKSDFLKYFKNLISFFNIWLHCEACRILVPWPRIEPMSPAAEAWSLNHWTTREVPRLDFSKPCHSTIIFMTHTHSCKHLQWIRN